MIYYRTMQELLSRSYHALLWWVNSRCFLSQQNSWRSE